MGYLEGRKGQFGGPDGAGFLGADAAGNSLWNRKSETGEAILKHSRDGVLLEKGYIVFQSDMPATEFWTAADGKLTAYKNYFFKDHMLVVGYGWGRK